MRAYHHVLPQIIDYSVHILRLCENHCQLVSKSGVLRVDLGIEFIECEAEQEAEKLREQLIPELWQSTGTGRIVRFFLNEVTSTLDINWSVSSTARVASAGEAADVADGGSVSYSLFDLGSRSKRIIPSCMKHPK